MTGERRLTVAAFVASVLAAMVVRPAFLGAYFLATVGVITIVYGIGVLLRAARFPRALVVVLMFVAAVETISVGFHHDTLVKHVFPWRETALAFGDDIAQALAGMQVYAPPLPSDAPYTVFAVVVMTAAALAIYALGVAARQAPWCGLLLLATYVVPAATMSTAWAVLTFIPAAAAFLVLLAADAGQRNRRWGRAVSRSGEASGVESSTAGAAGRRIAVIAVVVAALAPILIPSVGSGLVDFRTGSGLGTGSGEAGAGGGTSTSANPILDVGRHLRQLRGAEALRYTGGGDDGVMLRLAALEKFDGNAWTLGDVGTVTRATKTPPPPAGYGGDLTAAPHETYKIKVADSNRSAWLPVPYVLGKLDNVKGTWNAQSQTLAVRSANGRTAAGLSYTAVGIDTSPDPEALEQVSDISPPDPTSMELPPGQFMNRIARAAKNATSGATTPYAKAVQLQEYFANGQFSYNVTDADGSGLQAIYNFIFTDKQGYCVQFSSAMALMARAVGIPSRVAIGYLPGLKTDNDTHVVDYEQEHAWPELYFPGSGWVRFEPTPAVQTGAPPAYTEPDNVPTGASSNSSSSASTGPSSSPSVDADKHNRPAERDSAAPSSSASPVPIAPGGGSGWGGWAVLRIVGWTALGLLVLGTPALVRLAVRRSRYRRAAGVGPPARGGAHRSGGSVVAGPRRATAAGPSPGPDGSGTADARAPSPQTTTGVDAGPLVEVLYAELRDTARDLGLGWPVSATPRQIGRWMSRRVPAEAVPAVRDWVRAVETTRYGRAPVLGRDLVGITRRLRRALADSTSRGRRLRARLVPLSLLAPMGRSAGAVRGAFDGFDLALARARRTVAHRGEPT